MEAALLAPLLGATVGAVLALSGAGGGIIAVPLLVFALGLPMADAAPIGLMAVGIAAAVGAALGLREGIVRYRAAALIGLVGMALAPAGVWLAQHTPNAPLMGAFALVLAATGWRQWRLAGGDSAPAAPPSLACRLDHQAGRLRWNAPCARALALTGALSGLLSGLLGVGGGFVIVPALARHTELDRRSILATSLAVIALVSIGGILAATAHGRIDWPLAGPFVAGALAALLAGRRLARRLAGPQLQRAFALLCLAVAVLMLARAGGLLQLGPAA